MERYLKIIMGFGSKKKLKQIETSSLNCSHNGCAYGRQGIGWENLENFASVEELHANFHMYKPSLNLAMEKANKRYTTGQSTTLVVETKEDF